MQSYNFFEYGFIFIIVLENAFFSSLYISSSQEKQIF